MRRPCAVLLLGPHRGGTSCMADIVARLGFDVGRDILGPHACNLKGLWENKAVVAFNEELLSACGSAWFDPSFLDLEEIMHAQGDPQPRLQVLLRTQYPTAADIVIKDPRLSRMGALYQRALEALGYRVRWVVALRHPSECADSLYRRDGIPRPVGHALWISHTLAALRAAHGGDGHMLCYEALISRPEDTLRHLVQWVHEGAPTAPQTLEDLKARIDPRLRHSRRAFPAPNDAGAPLVELAETIFGSLQSGPCRRLGRDDVQDWEARYRALLPTPGWCRSAYRLVCYQPPESTESAISAAFSAAPARYGILVIRDGGDDVPLGQSLARASAVGRLGLFYNLGLREEAASLVRGIALRAGRGALLLRQRALPRLSEWLNWLDTAEIPRERVLTWGGLDTRDPDAVFVPDKVAARLDPWIHVEYGPEALQSFLEAVRSLQDDLVESRTAGP